jgi:hypothetical protein
VTGDDPRISLDVEPTAEALGRLSGKLHALRAEAVRALDRGLRAPPAIVVTPLGHGRADDLERALAALGVHPVERRAIPSFPEASSALYVRAFDDVSLRRALGFEAAWRRLFPEGRAERWALCSPGDHAIVAREKHRVRREIPSRPVIVEHASLGFRAPLHAFHLADPEDLAVDSMIMEMLTEPR